MTTFNVDVRHTLALSGTDHSDNTKVRDQIQFFDQMIFLGKHVKDSLILSQVIGTNHKVAHVLDVLGLSDVKYVNRFKLSVFHTITLTDHSTETGQTNPQIRKDTLGLTQVVAIARRTTNHAVADVLALSDNKSRLLFSSGLNTGKASVEGGGIDIRLIYAPQ